MVCTHLRELYDLCEKNQLRLGSSDLIRLVCKQCNQEETCPSVLMDDIVLVAMTGYGQNTDQQRSQRAGFDHHFVKPVEFRTLRQFLAAVSEKVA
jgi:CheY-like chemotaxis protein